MPLYSYKAVDSQGKLVKGEMEAASEVELTTQLAKLGHMPVSINFKSSKTKQAAGKYVRKAQKVSQQSLVIFTRQFATIIKAAVPILEGLGVLAEQSEDPLFKDALNKIIREVEGGSSLSQAMAKHPGIFSELYINTVIAGEKAGVLDKVLMRLSKMLEEDLETRTNMMAALRYPIMVVFALIAAVCVLSIFVVPQFAKIYLDAHVKLPLPTQVMILISNILIHYWFIVIPFLAGLYFAVNWYINTLQGRFLWDGMKFKIMIFGKVYTKITMLRFASMLSVLYQAGLPVLNTLDIVGMTIGNAVLSKEVEGIKREVADGRGISGAVLNSRFFPRLVGYMISIGEKSGSLPMMLDSLCEYYDLEVKTTIRNLTTMIEPIMTAVLGSVIMGMALAIFLPLWDMISVIKSGG
ncbi:MAG: type II secretion system F family protein [Candidatus Omnitrophica bacterium]|nr:type II secretion system F family protein [Candidatus Omnitrophota bacterium]